MSNQTPTNDPKPDESGDTNPTGGYQPPSYGGQPAGGYNPPAWGGQPSAPSGSEAPGGYGAQGGGYNPPSYGGQPPAPGGQYPPGYGVPSTPDQTFGQTPSYGAPTQDPYGQPGSPYGAPQGGYDPNAGGYGQAPGYGAPGPYDQGGYGTPSPYGGYQPSPYASGPQLATWGRRAIGGLIDFVAPSFVVGIIISSLLGNAGQTTTTLISWVLTIGWWAYNTGYRVATTGYSFGHKIAKVRVVMEDTGQTPPLNTAILRAVSHLLDQLVCAIGFLFPLWDAKKQTFADKIAKTVVLDEQNVQR